MSYGMDVVPGEIEGVVARLCDLYPAISKADHLMIVETTYDNYFGKEGVFEWYAASAEKLTPDVLAEIRKNPHDFFFCESHLAREGVYTPLAARTD